MLTSGTDPINTDGDDAVDLIANAESVGVNFVNVINTGTVDGFVSVDSGRSWAFMPGGPKTSRTFDLRLLGAPRAVVKAKRIAGGDDMFGLYADAI